MNLYRRLGISGDALKQMEAMLSQSMSMMRYLRPWPWWPAVSS